MKTGIDKIMAILLNICKMKKYITLLVLLMGLAAMVGAQEKAITGKVTSTDDGSALGQVNIQVLGKDKSATTNEDGTFTMEGISENDILVFSLDEHHVQNVPVGKLAVVNVGLMPIFPKPNNVKIPILPGKEKPVFEMGYASGHEDGDKIELSGANNVISALTGLMPGVQVTHPDGVNGGTTRITIRGNDNIRGNNQPLIVIDGMPIENNPGMVNPSRGQDWGSEINHLLATDISTVDIIKGNAAAAYYGPRAANGAILISTKKGAVKPGLGVTYGFTYNIEKPYRYRETQNKYGAGSPTSLNAPSFEVDGEGNLLYPTLQSNDSLVLQNGYSTTSNEFGKFGTSSSWGPEMNGQEIKWWDGTTKTWSPQPDNIKLPFTNGTSTQHNLSVEGGNEWATMRLSVSRTDARPIVYNSNFNQTTISVSSVIRASDKVMVDISASYLDYYHQNSPMLGDDSASIGKGLLYSWPRSYQGEDFHNYQKPNFTRTDLTGIPYGHIDPYFWWGYQKHNTELFRSNLTSTVVATYDVTSWLKFVCSTGINFGYDRWETRHQPIDLVGLEGGHFAKDMGRTQSNSNSFLLALKKDNISDSKIGVEFSVGGSSLLVDNYSEGGNSGTWYYPNKYTFSNFTSTSNTTVGDPGSLVAATENIYKRKLLSMYSFLTLSYSNFLYVDVTGRNDWSSTMPSDENSYFYPSVSANFVASNALNLDKDLLSYWNVRGGFYQTKIDADPYLLDWSYSASAFGNNQATVFSGIVPDTKLKPQQTNSFELGTYAEFLNNLFSFNITYYKSETSDQIISSPAASSTGAYIINTNIGSISNTGIEIALTSTPIKNKDFYYTTGLSFSKNSNEVLDLGGAEYIEIGNFDGENSPSLCVKKGEQYGTIYGYDYQYIDGERVVSDDGTHYLISETKMPIGNIAPKFFLGWTNKLSYKNVSLFALVDAKIGGEIYSGSYVYGLLSGQSPETLLERDGGGVAYTSPDGTTSNTGVILDGVYADGSENTTVVHYYYKYMPNSGGYGQTISRPGIVENSYIKLREVALSYTLPTDLIRKIKFVQGLSVNFTCRNVGYLYTTLPDNINPEGILGAGNAQAFEYGAMPGTRTFSFGINAKF